MELLFTSAFTAFALALVLTGKDCSMGVSGEEKSLYFPLQPTICNHCSLSSVPTSQVRYQKKMSVVLN